MSNIKEISAYKSTGNTIITVPKVIEKERGGIIFAEESQNETLFEIIELGAKFDHPDLAIGDTVMVAGKGGDRIDLQDTTYWIYPVDMVIAKVE